MTTPDHFVRPAKLAAELDVAESTLGEWRKKGIGPRWVRLGPRVIAYRRSDVDAWLEQQAGAA